MNRETLWVRGWALRNVFLLWFVRPRIVALTDDRCEVVIPLSWRTRRRDIHAMYLGVLVMGADVAGGLIAFNLIARSKKNVSFLFKDVKGEFLKRAEDDVHFVCQDGAKIRDLVSRALSTGERQEATVDVTATVPTKLSEPVARFALTLSVKRRESKS
ncbi:MAG TPA: DUF4442 domain-containing protein [Thermoanaerobaculia bacterium]|nr:DUF4442 domain-containing protein [Thermoanaerobaculia bacterium]